MSTRNIILLVVALFIAGATAFGLKSRAPQPAAVQEEAAPSMQKILVAKRDIGAGSFVNAGNDLEWAAWPLSAVQSYHIKEGSDDAGGYEGAVARRAVKAGEPVTPTTLVKPGSGGFLSAVLEPGKRAVSIAVSATSGASGFIFPGDRVDLLVTHRMKVKETEQGDEQETIVSETFAENVRVVAVDQMLDNPENKAVLAKTVTVEVSPEQAERISVAENMGKLSVSLRSLAADNARAPADATAGGENSDAAATENAESAESDANSEASQNPIAGIFQSGVGGPENAIESPEIHRITRDTDVSQALDRSGTVSPRILVIRGDKSEKREFFQDR